MSTRPDPLVPSTGRFVNSWHKENDSKKKKRVRYSGSRLGLIFTFNVFSKIIKFFILRIKLVELNQPPVTNIFIEHFAKLIQNVKSHIKKCHQIFFFNFLHNKRQKHHSNEFE